MSTILEVNRLQQKFGNVYALRDISFSMKEGEIICILGPSGCGKSTLLQQIAGIQQPYHGEILIDQKPVANKSFSLPPEKRQINMVFQDYALWPHMNVYENIAYGLKRQKLTSKERDTRIDQFVELLNLHGLLKRLPAHLSGGQQQRIGIARALATNPRILLMDEPLSNLDIKLRMHMRNELSSLLRKLEMSVLYVTHDMYEAFALADRLMILKDGLIEQFAAPKEVFESPSSPWVAQLLCYMNKVEGILSLPDSKSGKDSKIGKVTIAGHQVKGRLQRAEAFYSDAASKEVSIYFHPEDAVILEQNISSPDSHNTIQGQVQYKVYEGRKWRIFIQLQNKSVISVTTTKPVEERTNVLLRFPIDRTFIYTN